MATSTEMLAAFTRFAVAQEANNVLLDQLGENLNVYFKAQLEFALLDSKLQAKQIEATLLLGEGIKKIWRVMAPDSLGAEIKENTPPLDNVEEIIS